MFWRLNRYKLFLVAMRIIFSSALEDNTIRFVNSTHCRIRGSKLYTGIWYHMTMNILRKHGVAMLTAESNSYINGSATQWRAQHVINGDRENLQKTEANSAWWKFVASVEYPGWYKLQNSATSVKGYITWTPTADYDEPKGFKGHSNYLVVMNNRKETEYLIRPVFQNLPYSQESEEYHQLKMQQHMDGKVAWSKHSYTTYFIKIFNGKRENLKPFEDHYKKYDDTLFVFRKVEKASTKYGNCDGSEGEADLESSGNTNDITAFFSAIVGLRLLFLMRQ